MTMEATMPDDIGDPSNPPPLTYVEFYSGIGGWTMALQEAVEAAGGSITLRRMAALDHSDLCTIVMEHNFANDPSEKKRKRQEKYSIETLSLEQAHAWAADIWTMSPPCQPHTRQHENQLNDLDDIRSTSFLNLCHLLSHMDVKKLPKLILLENVVGFELSGSFERWRTALEMRGYKTDHFHLTPTQVGLPNDRPRYYCVAVLTSLDGHGFMETNDTKSPVNIHQSLPNIRPLDDVSDLPPISSFLDDSKEDTESLLVSPKILYSHSSWCFDIVTPTSQRSSCFTSSYGRFIKGTGSVLYTGKAGKDTLVLQTPSDRQFQANWKEDLDNLEKTLRYFSGSEIARIMGFPDDFTFPATISLKQQWKLLGNSLNVKVAAKVSDLGLRMAFGEHFNE